MLAVVVPTFHTLQASRLLRDLAAQRRPCRVYVIDNSNGRTPVRVPDGMNARVLRPSENLGWLKGVNTGWREALRDSDNASFLLINDDVRLSPEFLTGLEAAAQKHPDAGLLGPVYDDVWENQLADHRGPADSYVPRKSERDVWGVDGTALYVTRDTIDAVGLLDEEAFGETGWGADIDYAIRVRQSGRRILVTERAFLNHLRAQTAESVYGSSYKNRGLRDLERGLSSKWGARWRELLFWESVKEEAPSTSGLRVAMVLGAGGDERLLDANLRFHLASGVDHIVVDVTGCDGKIAATVATYQNTGRVESISCDDPATPYNQRLSAAALRARREYHAAAVLYSRPDRFWLSRQGRLGEEVVESDWDCLSVLSLSVLMADRGGKEDFARDSVAVVTSVSAHPTEDTEGNPYLHHSASALALRTKKGCLPLDSDARAFSGPALLRGSAVNTIVLQYPVRSWRSFLEEVRGQIDEVPVSAHSDLPDTVRREWERSCRKGTLQRHYRKLLVPPGRIGGQLTPLAEFVQDFTRTSRLPELPGLRG